MQNGLVFFLFTLFYSLKKRIDLRESPGGKRGKSVEKCGKVPKRLCPLVVALDGQNRQSPIASVQRTRSTLAGHSAVPRGTNTTPMNANSAIRIAAQRTKGLRGPNPVFSGEI